MALDWGVIGNVRPLTSEYTEMKSDIAWNCIITCEVQGTSKTTMCHFALQTQVKEMISPSYVYRMFPGCLLWTSMSDKLKRNFCPFKTQDF